MTGGWSTPIRDRMEVGETFVQGRDQQTARALLAAAEDLGLPALVVRTNNHGFVVPDEVWDRVQQQQAEAEGHDF